MELFGFEPDDHRARYQDDGWLHVPGGATSEFCEQVRGQVAAASTSGITRPGITVAKEQYLLELPQASDVVGELFDCVSTVCGLDRRRLTLSERHINVYGADADARPRPHKDRFASQVSVGVSIAVPPGSHLVLWLDDDRSANPLQRAGITETLHPDQAPEVVLAASRATTLFDSPGDVVMFPGSAVWHTRRNPAGAIVTYFKCNDFGSDPLAEDPGTPRVERVSCELAARDSTFRPAVPALSRRFESVTREHALRAGTVWLNVLVTGQAPKRITERELELLKAVDGQCTVNELIGKTWTDDATALRRLVALGALELAPADRWTKL
jgi:hypothetical protein